MSILNELSTLSSAEDFFVSLGLTYDPAVVNVARLHIMRRMGQYLRGDEIGALDDAAARLACKMHLAKAYDDFVQSSPIAERVFKVHQDALKPTEQQKLPFIPLSAITEVSV